MAPVVVRPETDSNTASVKPTGTASEISIGSAPITPSTDQNRVTTRKPSRTCSSARWRKNGSHSASPSSMEMVNDTRKGPSLPSRYR